MKLITLLYLESIHFCPPSERTGVTNIDPRWGESLNWSSPRKVARCGRMLPLRKTIDKRPPTVVSRAFGFSLLIYLLPYYFGKRQSLAMAIFSVVGSELGFPLRLDATDSSKRSHFYRGREEYFPINRNLCDWGGGGRGGGDRR